MPSLLSTALVVTAAWLSPSVWHRRLSSNEQLVGACRVARATPGLCLQLQRRNLFGFISAPLASHPNGLSGWVVGESGAGCEEIAGGWQPPLEPAALRGHSMSRLWSPARSTAASFRLPTAQDVLRPHSARRAGRPGHHQRGAPRSAFLPLLCAFRWRAGPCWTRAGERSGSAACRHDASAARAL